MYYQCQAFIPAPANASLTVVLPMLCLAQSTDGVVLPNQTSTTNNIILPLLGDNGNYGHNGLPIPSDGPLYDPRPGVTDDERYRLSGVKVGVMWASPDRIRFHSIGVNSLKQGAGDWNWGGLLWGEDATVVGGTVRLYIASRLSFERFFLTDLALF